MGGGEWLLKPSQRTGAEISSELCSTTRLAFHVKKSNALFQKLYAASMFGTLGIGTIGVAYFSHLIDQSCNRSLQSIEEFQHNVDLRIVNVEKAMKIRSKEQERLQSRTNTLCKFANLLNDNPTEQICNHGLNPGKVMAMMTPIMVAGSVGIGLAGNRGEDNTEGGVAEPENGPW